MRIARGSMLVPLASLCLAACSDVPSTLLGSSVPDAARQTPTLTIEQATQNVARGIALALSDREMRLAVRDAMRASPYVEHKLVLQEFLATGSGSKLLVATAARMGMTASNLG